MGIKTLYYANTDDKKTDPANGVIILRNTYLCYAFFML